MLAWNKLNCPKYIFLWKYIQECRRNLLGLQKYTHDIQQSFNLKDDDFVSSVIKGLKKKSSVYSIKTEINNTNDDVEALLNGVKDDMKMLAIYLVLVIYDNDIDIIKTLDIQSNYFPLLSTVMKDFVIYHTLEYFYKKHYNTFLSSKYLLTSQCNMLYYKNFLCPDDDNYKIVVKNKQNLAYKPFIFLTEDKIAPVILNKFGIDINKLDNKITYSGNFMFSLLLNINNEKANTLNIFVSTVEALSNVMSMLVDSQMYNIVTNNTAIGTNNQQIYINPKNKSILFDGCRIRNMNITYKPKVYFTILSKCILYDDDPDMLFYENNIGYTVNVNKLNKITEKLNTFDVISL